MPHRFSAFQRTSRDYCAGVRKPLATTPLWLAATALRSVRAVECKNGSTALLANTRVPLAENGTSAPGRMHSPSRAIWSDRPRTIDVEHDDVTAVATEISLCVSPYVTVSSGAAQ